MSADAPWRMAAASAVGTSHLADGFGCQDAVACAARDGGRLLVAAVSDGAGSARASRLGAQAAVERFVAAAGVPHLDGSRRGAEDLVRDVRSAVERAAAEAGFPLRDCACTLLGVVASGRRLATFQIGDGAIVAGAAGAWNFAYWPQHGEYANLTNFLTDDGYLETLEADVEEMEFDEIALFSDGLERLVLRHAERAVHAPFFESVMRPVRGLRAPGLDAGLSVSLGAYLASEAVNARTDDDKSLLLATRRPPEGV